MIDIIDIENTHIILPFYNIYINKKIQSIIYNRDILGYKISSIEFLEKKFHFLKETCLKEISSINFYKPVYSLVLYKEHKPSNKGKKNLNDIFFIEEIIEKFILALRIYKSNMFCCENIFYYFPQFKTDHVCYSENQFFPRFGKNLNINELFGLPYNITSIREIKKILEIYKLISKNWNDMKIGLLYFNKYYSSKDNYDKILNLSIVLENLILPDNPEDISETLSQRIAYLLDDKNLYEKIKEFYIYRSEIIHNGLIKKKINNNNYILEIEEIVRKVIKKVIYFDKREDLLKEYKYNTKIDLLKIFKKNHIEYKKIPVKHFYKIVQEIDEHMKNIKRKNKFKKACEYIKINKNIDYVEYHDNFDFLFHDKATKELYNRHISIFL